MSDYHSDGCRRLVAEVLYRAMADVAKGTAKERARARYWIRGQYSAYLAELIDINVWPPTDAAYIRLRKELAYAKKTAS